MVRQDIIFFILIILYTFFNGNYKKELISPFVFFAPVIFCILNIKYIKKLNKNISILLCLLLTYPFMTNYSYYIDNINEYIKYISNILFIMFFPYIIIKRMSKENRRKILKVYVGIVKLNIVITIIQFLLIKKGINHNFFWQYATRPSGLLAEPSFQFSLYLPLIYIFLKTNFISNIWKILIYISLFITMSFSNLVCCLLLIISDYRNIWKNIKTVLIFIPILFIVLAINLGSGNNKLNDIENINRERLKKSMRLETGSAKIRLIRPIRIFLENENILFGVGIKNEKKIIELIKKTNYDGESVYEVSPLYMNGFFKEFIFFGAIGGILLNLFYYILFGKNCMLVFIAFFLLRVSGGTGYNSGIILIYIILINIVKSIIEKSGESNLCIKDKQK